jgi:6-phosphogluconolactonase
LHSVVASPSGKLFSVCDKGADRIYLFRIEENQLAVAGEFKTNPGYAPRYSAFHPTRPFLFVNNEFQPYLHTFRYDEDGKLEKAGCVQVLPEGVENPAKHGQSDILVSPDGKYLYDMFRHINMIFVFQIDHETGALTRIQSFQSEGKTLRSCHLSPDGRFMLVAADESQNVLTYPMNPDGTLGPAVQSLMQIGPAHLAFYRPQNPIFPA